MDEVADRIAQDMKDIVRTRVAIAEKLGAIEEHVGTTMQHARTTMTQVANKTTTSVQETMQATKEAFDLRLQAARHPWILISGAVVAGYGFGSLYHRDRRVRSGVVPYYPRIAQSAPVMPKTGTADQKETGVYSFYPPGHEGDHGRGEPDQADRSTVVGELERAFHDEIGAVRGKLVGFGRGLIREMVRQAVPAFVHIITGTRRERNPRSARDNFAE